MTDEQLQKLYQSYIDDPPIEGVTDEDGNVTFRQITDEAELRERVRLFDKASKEADERYGEMFRRLADR